MVESDSPFPHDDLSPNWAFYTQVLDRALQLVEQAVRTHDPSPFLQAESLVAIAESREAVDALTAIMRRLEREAAKPEPAPLRQVNERVRR